jgi:hypothetical protein
MSLAPDLVLADVPYLTLAAAHQAGISAVALCSLNWADIYRWYFSSREESGQVLAQMQAAYRHAALFLCPEPSMPMAFLANRLAIGPIAKQANAHGVTLRQQLGIAAEKSVVAVAPGGISSRFDMEKWPANQGIHWLVSKSWEVDHVDASPLEELGWSFTDILASCDAVLGKCGYGTVVECVTNGTPLLYVSRPDWPEERSLADWLDAHDAGVKVDPQRLVSGVFSDLVEAARSTSVKTCMATGAAEAAALLEAYFLQRATLPVDVQTATPTTQSDIKDS